MSEHLLHVTFVCTGNICRSPMAEKMFAHQIAERGLTELVRVNSAGTGGWHAGSGADVRAVRVLHERGYPTAHRAAQHAQAPPRARSQASVGLSFVGPCDYGAAPPEFGGRRL